MRHLSHYFGTFYARRSFRIFPLYHIILTGYILTVTMLGSQRPDFGRLFENPLPVWTSSMRALGNWAYSTYLFHPILLCSIFRLMKHHDPTLAMASDLLPLGTALVTTFVLA